MVDIIVRSAGSGNAVSILRRVTPEYAVELCSEWIHAGVGDGLTVEVVRSADVPLVYLPQDMAETVREVLP